MTLNEKIIESRFVPDKNLLIEGYMKGLKRDMIEQNEDIIDLSEEEPKFYFEEWPVKKPDLN